MHQEPGMYLQQINTQLSRHGVLVKQGATIDARATPTLRKPRGQDK